MYAYGVCCCFHGRVDFLVQAVLKQRGMMSRQTRWKLHCTGTGDYASNASRTWRRWLIPQVRKKVDGATANQDHRAPPHTAIVLTMAIRAFIPPFGDFSFVTKALRIRWRQVWPARRLAVGSSMRVLHASSAPRATKMKIFVSLTYQEKATCKISLQ